MCSRVCVDFNFIIVVTFFISFHLFSYSISTSKNIEWHLRSIYLFVNYRLTDVRRLDLAETENTWTFSLNHQLFFAHMARRLCRCVVIHKSVDGDRSNWPSCSFGYGEWSCLHLIEMSLMPSTLRARVYFSSIWDSSSIDNPPNSLSIYTCAEAMHERAMRRGSADNIWRDMCRYLVPLSKWSHDMRQPASASLVYRHVNLCVARDSQLVVNCVTDVWSAKKNVRSCEPNSHSLTT